MSKSTLVVLLVTLLTLLHAAPVHAVFIQVNDQGDVLFFQDQVLGEEDEEERQEEVKKIEQKPIKSVTSDQKKGEKTEVRLKPVSKEDTQIELRKKEGTSSRTIEKKEDKRVEMEFSDKEAELRELRLKNEKELKEFKQNLNNSGSGNKEELLKRKELELEKELEEKEDELRKMENGEEPEIRQNEESMKDNQPLRPLSPRPEEETQARRKEKVMQLRDAVNNNKRELELESEGGMKARFSQGAEIVVDSELGTVKLVTPNGQEKELNNFPDEVIEKLRSQQSLETDDMSEIEVEVDSTGQIKHKIKNVTKRKRLFGFIPREIQVEAEVDDATGDVVVTETEQGTLNQMLNLFSL